MRKDQYRRTKAYASYIRPIIEKQKQIIIGVIKEAIERSVYDAREETSQASCPETSTSQEKS